MLKPILMLAAAAALAAPVQAAPRLTPEQQLAKALEGRVAGKPVSCIDPRANANSQVINKTAIIYGSGHTIYLQKPADARSLRDDDILVTEIRGGGQLCNLDIIRLHDRNGLFFRGFVNLEDFVPYTRTAPIRKD